MHSPSDCDNDDDVLILPTFYRAAFMGADPKSVKIQSSLQYLFALLGYTCIKAACKHVGEIDPICHFYQHRVSVKFSG